jgi:hypothetical protein
MISSAETGQLSLVLLLLIGTLTSGIHAYLTARPSNVIDLAGSKVTLLCSSTALHSQINWTFVESGRKNETLITTTIVSGCVSRSPNYTTMSVKEGQCNLVINYLTFYHAGRYTCNDSSDYFSAKLGVMISVPSFVTNTTSLINVGDFVGMNYRMDYYGEFIVKVATHRADIPPRSQGNSSISPRLSLYKFHLYIPFSMRISIFLTAKKPKLSSYYCTTTFRTVASDPPLNEEATNDPTYRYDLQTDPLPIPYRPGMFYMTINGKDQSDDILTKHSGRIGEKINCHAATSPQPSYQWTDPNGFITYGSVVTLSILGYRLKYKCSAWNYQGNNTVDYIVSVYSTGSALIPHHRVVYFSVGLSWMILTFFVTNGHQFRIL